MLAAYRPIERYILLAVGLGLLCYIVLRAVFVPLVHDEAATFFHFIHDASFLPFVHASDANNHILNSLLGWMSYRAFGAQEWALRVPNILGGALWLWFSLRLAGRLNQRTLRWSLLLLLWGAHYLIEWFSLCRGYGLSLGLLMVALWGMSCIHQQYRLRTVAWTSLFLALACLANLALATTVAIAFAVLVIQTWKNKKLRWKGLLVLFFCGGLLFLYATAWLWHLKNAGLLFYGSDEGFFAVTIKSLVKVFSGSRSESLAVVLAVFCGVALLITASHLIRIKLKGLASTFGVLLFGYLLAIFGLYLLLGVNFPEDRAAVHLFPLLIISLVFTLDEVKVKAAWKSLLIVPALVLPVHFVLKSNFTHVDFWAHERIPSHFYEHLTKLNTEPPVTVGGRIVLEMTWAWQQFKSQQVAGTFHHAAYPQLKTDWIIVNPADHPDLIKQYRPVYLDGPSGNALMRRTKPYDQVLVSRKELVAITTENTNEYIDLWRGSADDFAGGVLRVRANITLNSSASPLTARYIVAVHRPDNQNARYFYQPLNWLRSQWTDQVPFTDLRQIDKVPEDANEIVIYLWNLNRQPINIMEGELVLERVTDT